MAFNSSHLRVFIALLLASWPWHPMSAADFQCSGSGCVCRREYRQPSGRITADCTRQVRAFPTDLPPSVSALYISCGGRLDNRGLPQMDFELINSVPRGPLQALPKLEEVHIMNCPILSLDPGAFSNLTRLRTLSLERLLLRRLNADVLRGSNALESLKIDYLHDLKNIDAALLNNKSSLRSLTLRYTSITGPVFAGLLQPLKGRHFKLIWSRNTLPITLPFNTFRQGWMLRSLDLNANHLTNLDFLANTRTFSLTLRHCQGIEEELPLRLASWKNQDLCELNLRSTGIRRLPPGSLAHFRRLSRLRLESNLLEEIPVDVYRHLASKLKLLRLWNNRIRAVPRAMEAMLKQSGFQMELNLNPIHCNCTMAWLLKYPQFLKNVECGSGPANRTNLRGRKLVSLTPNEVCT